MATAKRTRPTIADVLYELSACGPAVMWARRLPRKRDFERAWNTCKYPGYLVWLAAELGVIIADTLYLDGSPSYVSAYTTYVDAKLADVVRKEVRWTRVLEALKKRFPKFIFTPAVRVKTPKRAAANVAKKKRKK